MVKHVLKDGTVLEDITGHVVKKEDVKGIYAIIDEINQKRVRKGAKIHD